MNAGVVIVVVLVLLVILVSFRFSSVFVRVKRTVRFLIVIVCVAEECIK